MKIQYVSDVHIEHHHRVPPLYWAENFPIVGDVLILAGDIASSSILYSNLFRLVERAVEEDITVLFVAGNHEYYGSNRIHIHNRLAKIMNKFPGYFRFLNKNVTEINGQRFVGCTLWWSCAPHFWSAIKQGLNDFNCIEGYSKWIAEASKEHREFLRANIRKGDVVITHHAPDWICRYATDENFKAGFNPARFSGILDNAYYNDLGNMIIEKEPRLWFYGHTHEYCNITLGETRILSNPHGYAKNGIPNLNCYGIIEI